MEKLPKGNDEERYSDAKKWFTGAQEELEKERQKTQEDHGREDAEKKRGDELFDMDEIQRKLREERAKTQEDYDKEIEQS